MTVLTKLDPLAQLHELATDLTTRHRDTSDRDPSATAALHATRLNATAELIAARRTHAYRTHANEENAGRAQALAEAQLAVEAAEDTLKLARLAGELAEVSALRARLILTAYGNYNAAGAEFDREAPIACGVAHRTRRLITHLTEAVQRELRTGQDIAPPVLRTAELVLDGLLDRPAVVQINAVSGPLSSWASQLETASRVLGVKSREFDDDPAMTEMVLTFLREHALDPESEITVATRGAVAAGLPVPAPVAQVGQIIDRLAAERRITYTRAAGWSNPGR